MNEETLFAEALLKQGEARAVFLDEHCKDDIALRSRLENLLRASDNPDPFLEAPAAIAGATIDELIAERPGTVIGPYKLLQQIGEGGMGMVFMAEQIEPVRRMVALKLIKEGMDSRQIIARFEAERQALALMDHPNIAKVFDGGTVGQALQPDLSERKSGKIDGFPRQARKPNLRSGRPYFVMELVKGLPITKYCDEHHLTPRQRLELFVPVCQAVQHAHQKGIIHRDLKPSNVLVAQYDGKPVPKVIDFGVAKAAGPKLTDMTLFTELGAVVGTFEYMSPEQAELNQLDVDTRSDIYSLGVLLYELLTGTTPLERGRVKHAALLEVLRLIREEEPPRPSLRLSDLGRSGLPSLANPATVPALKLGPTASLASISALRQTEPAKLTRSVRGELDWIVMKALEKDRNRRYETANGLAMDVQRYLADEAVQACPPSAGYRVRKFARRNRAAFWTTGVVALALIVGSAVSAWQAVRATQQSVRATEAEGLAQERLKTATSNYNEAEEQRQAAKTQEGLANEQRKIAVSNEKIAKEQESLARRRFYAAQMNLAQQAWEKGDPVRVLRLLESQRPKFDQEDLRAFEWYYLWGLCNRQRRLFTRYSGSTLALSPDGKTLAFAEYPKVKIWDLVTKPEPVNWRERHLEAAGGYCLAFSPNGMTLAAGTWDCNVNIFDLTSLRITSTLKGGFGEPRCLAFSPDGKSLAAGMHEQKGYKGGGLVKLWNVATGQEIAILKGHQAAVMSVSFSPDSRTLASASSWNDEKVKLWDLATQPPRLIREWSATGPVKFFPDGKTLAAGNWDNVNLLDLTSEAPREWHHIQGSFVSSIDISRDGKTIAVGSGDRTLRLWEPATGRQSRLGHFRQVSFVAFMPDDKSVMSAGGGCISLWDVSQESSEAALPEVTAGSHPCYSPDGKMLAIAASENVVKLCDPITAKEQAKLMIKGGSIRGLQFSSDSKRLAVKGTTCVEVWDTVRLQHLGTFSLGMRDGSHAMALAPDGKTLACGGEVWDVDTQEVRTTFEGPGGGCDSTFSPDGNALIIAEHTTIQIRNSRTFAKEFEFRLPTTEDPYPRSLAISPNGKILFISGKSGWLFSFDRDNGRLLATFNGHSAAVTTLVVSPDGKTLVSGSDDGTTKLWDISTGQERFNLVGHEGKPVKTVAIAPDGKTLATCSYDGKVKFWKAADDREARAFKNELEPDDPDSPLILLNEADALRIQGRVDTYARAEERLTKLVARFPQESAEAKGMQTQLKNYRFTIATSMVTQGRWREGEQAYVKLIDQEPNNPLYHNNLAWLLAICPEETFRDPKRAVELAKKAVELAPKEGNYWNTLGVAHYRAGDGKAAIAALEKSTELSKGGDANDWFFLAMAHGRLGHKEEARKWFDQAVQWMEKNAPKNEELIRFRSEAQKLLGVTEKK